jgi:hypothetical protein
MTLTAPTSTRAAVRRPALQRVAAAVAGLIALLYALLSAGVLEIPGASSEELGILGAAAGVFVVIAWMLWRWHSRILWIAVAGIQVLMGWMYLDIAPDRNPSFEVWGVTIRAVSVVLVVTLIALLLTDHRARVADHRARAARTARATTDRPATTDRTDKRTDRPTPDLEEADLRVIDLHPADRARR